MVSPKRWAVSIVSCIATIAAIIVLFCVALNDENVSQTPNPLIALGFGSFSPNAIIQIGIPQEGTTGLAGCVLLANLPQVILSFLYLMYNGLYTSMHMAHEYGGYATERKSLRVTTPRGTQRSTYWLQLPYTYGMPLILAIRRVPGARASLVASDNATGATRITEHLISLGHRRIAFLGGMELMAVRKDRVAGFTRALEEAGLRADPALMLESMPSKDGGFTAMSNLLARPEWPTAVVCFNDVVAIGAMLALGRKGVAALRRRSVGYVFQDYNLIPALTAAENIALPRELDGVPVRKARKEARAALEEMNLLEIIGNVLRNAFIRAYLPRFEGSNPDVQWLEFGTGSLLDQPAE